MPLFDLRVRLHTVYVRSHPILFPSSSIGLGMEALSTLEDRLSTKAAFILLGCATFAVTGIGLAVLLNKVTRRRIGSQVRQEEGDFCAAIKDMLMGSLRWSGPSKWKERGTRRGSEGRPLPLLAMEGYGAEIIGWQSHNSESPVWQRPILMGEKCELPRFSGLILYDELGRLLSDSCAETAHQQQGKGAAGVRTTLRDLL